MYLKRLGKQVDPALLQEVTRLSNKIEKALEAWWDASNEGRRAKVESDLALSAILFADPNLSVDVLADWVTRRGLPQPPAPRYPLQEALDRIEDEVNEQILYARMIDVEESTLIE